MISTPVRIETPQPLARIKQPTLLQELRQYTAEPVAAESAAILATGKARLWLMATGAALALTITAARNHQAQWLPIAYVGGSVTVSLLTGASLEGSKAKAHSDIAIAINTARPKGAIASAWLSTEARQLKHFDKLVSEHLFSQWRIEQPALTVAAQSLPAAVLPPAEDLGQQPKSALIGGVPGSGKTLFYLNALAHLKQHHPEFQVMLINPKSTTTERGTDSAPALVMSRNFSKGEPDELALWLWDCIEQFNRWEGPKLLILDETAAVMGALKLASRSLQIMPKFKSWLTNITSMGDSDRHLVWFVSQDCSADGLGLSSALRATMRAIALVAPHNRQALQAFLAGQWVPLPEGGQAELDQLMDSSEVNRAIFDGKQRRWLPLEKLPNLTGWDRDNGKAIPQEACSAIAPAQPAPFWEEEPEFDYFDLWKEWLQNRTEPTTVRDATRLAPRQVRVNGTGTIEAFKQLERMKFGQYDVATKTFTVATAAHT